MTSWEVKSFKGPWTLKLPTKLLTELALQVASVSWFAAHSYYASCTFVTAVYHAVLTVPEVVRSGT